MWYYYANSFNEAKLRAIEALTKYDSRAHGVMIIPVKKDYFEVTVYEFEETFFKKMKEKENKESENKESRKYIYKNDN